MNVHEYQAKSLLREAGISVAKGEVAATPEEAGKAFERVGARKSAVKAQIHAGGRGKAGGIKVVDSAAAAVEAARGMLGKPLVTHQTGPQGRIVHKVLVEEGLEVERELYLGLVIDRKSERPVMMACAEGGMEIEELAVKAPDKILKEELHGALGLQPFQARKLAERLGLPVEHHRAAAELFLALARLFVAKDCSLAEINPLALVKGRGIMAIDAKLNFDDRALYRHPDVWALHDIAEEDPTEWEATQMDVSYVSLDGDIACMVNGAGLAMSTMDVIKLAGGSPANFLDVGGGANQEQVTKAFKLLLSNRKVKAVLVNIFGGIMHCDVIAKGVIGAAREVALKVPLVVRLEGTNVKEGRELLAKSGLNLLAATDLNDAAKKVVAAAAGTR